MDTHKLARQRVLNALVQKGFCKKDAVEILEQTLQSIREQPTSCVDLVQGLLGLEWEYISPLFQPKKAV